MGSRECVSRTKVPEMKRLLAVGAGLAVAGLIGVGLLFFSRAWHPEFGLIRSTQMAEEHTPSSFERFVADGREFLRKIFKAAAPPLGQREYLHLGSNQLEWSLMSTELKSGWLYFSRPEANTFIWEFAPSTRVNLADVTRADLGQAHFVRAHDTNQIKSAFDADSWVETNARLTVGGRTIPVREGQIVLARLISAPDTVYVLKFKNQVGADSWGGIRIDYLQGEARPPEQDRRANENP